MLDRHLTTRRISAILHDPAERASQRLQAFPMPSQPVFAATDEISDHGQPVLALIAYEHLCVPLISKEAEADATTWGVRLLRYAHLVKDQGAAMPAGMADAGILPDSACGSDVFHCLLTFGREARTTAHYIQIALREGFPEHARTVDDGGAGTAARHRRVSRWLDVVHRAPPSRPRISEPPRPAPVYASR